MDKMGRCYFLTYVTLVIIQFFTSNPYKHTIVKHSTSFLEQNCTKQLTHALRLRSHNYCFSVFPGNPQNLRNQHINTTSQFVSPRKQSSWLLGLFRYLYFFLRLIWSLVKLMYRSWERGTKTHLLTCRPLSQLRTQCAVLRCVAER